MRSWKESGPAASQALAMIFMYLYMNIFSLLNFTDTIVGTRLLDYVYRVDFLSLSGVVLVAVVVVAWIAYISSGKYKHIIEEYERISQTETVERQKAWVLYLRIYEIGSIVILLLSVMTEPMRPK